MEVKEGYGHLEKIITYGFLPSVVRYKDNVIVFKTLTDKEHNQIAFCMKDGEYSWSTYRLAFSTFMINGYNCLENRTESIEKLLEFYSKLPITTFLKFLQDVDDIYGIYLESLKFLEGYCYTDDSRIIWKIFNSGMDDTSYYYGIPGIKNVGLNSAKENWILINKQLDEEDSYGVQFRLSLMVASSFNGEGAKSLGNNFDFHKKELEETRLEISKYGYDKRRIEKKKQEDGWAKLPRTREEMVKELNREMSGHKDKHDLFLDACIAGEKKRAEDAKKSVEEKQKKFRETVQKDVDETKVEGSRAATEEEIKSMMDVSKNRNPSVAIASEVYEKYGQREKVIKKLSTSVIKQD